MVNSYNIRPLLGYIVIGIWKKKLLKNLYFVYAIMDLKKIYLLDNLESFPKGYLLVKLKFFALCFQITKQLRVVEML